MNECFIIESVFESNLQAKYIDCVKLVEQGCGATSSLIKIVHDINSEQIAWGVDRIVIKFTSDIKISKLFIFNTGSTWFAMTKYN